MENKAAGSKLVEDAQRKSTQKSWLLSTPALLILAFAASGPLLIVLVYSFISSGEYGGVVWKFSTDAWFNVVFHRDIFDGTLALADAHLIILWRSIKLSFFTTVTTLAIGFPTAYFIATRPRKTRNIWLFLITIPFWTNLLIRTFAILEVIRNEGLINIGLQAFGVIDGPIQMLYTDFAIMVGMTYVYLPLMVEGSEVESHENTYKVTGNEAGRILFVDDEEAIREIAKEDLETFGYEVTLQKKRG